MTIQIQKEEFVADGGAALDLSALSWALSVAAAGDRVRAAYQRWGRAEARRQVAALSDALGEVAGRVAREPVREATALEARRRAKLDRVRVVAEVRAEAGRGLTEADRRALTEADALEAQAGQIGSRDSAGRLRRTAAQRAEAGRMQAQALTLRNGVSARRDQADRLALGQRRMSALVDLEAGREGEAEVVEKRRGQTAVRLRTRDGLKLAHERGTFTPRDADGRARDDMAARIEAARLLAVGLRYRDRYEVAQASIKSCLAQADGVKAAPTLFQQAMAARRRAALANQVRVLDIAVAAKVGPLGLEALRMVAGEARTVRSLSASSKRRDRLTQRLVEALHVVADILSGPS